MSETKTGLAAVAIAAGAVSQADHDKALADANTAATTLLTEGVAKAKADGVKEGATAERTRVKAILGSEQAKGRESLAQHFAFETEDTAEKALAALDKSPKAEASKPRLGGAVPQPNVDAVDDSKKADAPAVALGASLDKQLGKLGKKPADK
jgi:hypothetical protein